MKWLYLSTLLMTSVFLNAQQESYVDFIKLKNGYSLTGEIVDYVDNEHVHIKLKGGKIIEVPLANVYRIRQKKGSAMKAAYHFKERGLYNVTTAAMSFNRAGGYSLTHAIGHRFNSKWSLGVGAGLENYENGEGKRVVPIFVEARGFLFNRKLSPYYSLRAGYGFALNNEERFIAGASGGVHFNPEVGYRLGGSDTLNLFIGIGMKIQNVSYRYEFPWDGAFAVEDIKYRRYMVNLGIVF